MAGSNVPAVGVEITARLEKFRTEMAKLGPEAGKAGKQIAAQLEREWKASQKAMRDTERAARQANDSVARLGDSAGKTGQSAAKLAGALDLVAPGAGSAARAVADIADVGEVAASASAALGVSLGPVAIVLGTVTAAAVIGTLAWKAYHEEETKAKQASEDLTSALQQLQPINTMARDSALDLARAQGKVTDSEYTLQRGVSAAGKAREAAIQKAREAIALAEEGAWVLKGDSLVREVNTEAIKDQVQVIDAANRAYEETVANLQRTKAATDRKTAADRHAAAATRDAAEASREWAKALAEEERQMAARARMDEQFAAGLERLEDARQTALDSNLEGIDRELAARQRLLQQVEETEAATLAAAKGSEDELVRVQEAQRDAELARQAIVEASEDRVLEIRQKAADADAKLALDAAKVREAALMQVVGSSAAALGQLFGDSKAAAFATASVNAALAITQALASLPPPFGAIEAAIIGGVTAGQIAKIQSTEASFGDTPGVVRMEDGGSVRLAAGDHFAAAQTREDLKRQVVGETPEVRVVAETHYRHQSFNRFIRDNLRTHGPLGTAIRGSTRVGHREV